MDSTLKARIALALGAAVLTVAGLVCLAKNQAATGAGLLSAAGTLAGIIVKGPGHIDAPKADQ